MNQPTTIECDCGARLRVPRSDRSVRVRCPRCKNTLSIEGASPIPVSSNPIPATEIVCPICQSALRETDALKQCPACGQEHHVECWQEVGGCSTYGCSKAPAPKKSVDAAGNRSHWGDTKKCPACGETIRSIALRCRYCDTDFDTIDPQSLADFKNRAGSVEERGRVQWVTSVVFALSLFGCLAPVMLVVSLVCLAKNRETWSKAGPLYSALGYISIIVSGVWCALILGFLLFGN